MFVIGVSLQTKKPQNIPSEISLSIDKKNDNFEITTLC